jgi:uncharacterized small protein (DUF1192 family)
MSEPIRYRPDWTYTGTAFVPFCRQQDNGEFIRYEDYARLKAEVERLVDDRCLRGEAMKQSQTRIAFLTEEVSRLKAAPFFADKKLAVAYDSPEYLTTENARLKAEVERLTKAVINAEDVIRFTEEGVQNVPFKYDEKYTIEVSRDAYFRLSAVVIADWNAAKEGKQP